MARSAQIVAIVLSCTVLFFVLVNYLHLRRQWTQEKFQTSLQKEFAQLSPLAMKELNAAGQELLPVYAREGQKQLNILMPEIAIAMRRELDNFCGDVIANTHTHLAESQDRVIAQTAKSVFAEYPDLKDPVKRQELHAHFEKETTRAVQASVLEFERLFSNDIETLKASLLKFDLKDGNESNVELQKKFLRLWLQLLDEEIKEI
jgi:phage gp37-like protein